ncbi:MAG: DUF6444 domain-containing protein [Pseudonocardiaceae bacterium]
MPGTLSVVGLLERLAQRDELVESLSAELRAARVRIAELAARLRQTSKNSSKPPSSVGQAGAEVLARARCPQARWAGRESRVDIAPVAVPDEVIARAALLPRL